MKEYSINLCARLLHAIGCRRSVNALVAAVALGLLAMSGGCRHDVVVDFPTTTKPGGDGSGDSSIDNPLAPIGFYLLNQGNMGMNKASIDYYDYSTGEYTLNLYLQANPDAVMALGDVGNQIRIYNGRLWAIINCSNKVEVMRASDCRRIGQVDIPNCRYMAFDGDYAYVTSYAGPVEIDEDYRQLGYVAKIDVNTLEVKGRCTVGYQPDGIAISGGKIYVANSGGYRVPNYERTLSVIDVATFEVEREVELGINLNNVVADSRGRIWVSSRGDYYDVEGAVYCYDPASDSLLATLPIDAQSIWLDSDRLYLLGNSFSYDTMTSTPSYHVVDTTDQTILQSAWEGATEFNQIKAPYCVAVDPVRGDIYITDAGNYVNPGYVYSFAADGTFKWRQRAGDVPASIAFLN